MTFCCIIDDKLSVTSFLGKLILDEKRPKTLKPAQQVGVRCPPDVPLLDGGRYREGFNDTVVAFITRSCNVWIGLFNLGSILQHSLIFNIIIFVPSATPFIWLICIYDSTARTSTPKHCRGINPFIPCVARNSPTRPLATYLFIVDLGRISGKPRATNSPSTWSMTSCVVCWIPPPPSSSPQQRF